MIDLFEQSDLAFEIIDLFNRFFFAVGSDFNYFERIFLPV